MPIPAGVSGFLEEYVDDSGAESGLNQKEGHASLIEAAMGLDREGQGFNHPGTAVSTLNMLFPLLSESNFSHVHLIASGTVCFPNVEM